jgi:acyl carrier protein
MENTDILLQINKIFQQVLKRDNINLSAETTAEDVQGWDSLTHIILIDNIESHFNVKFKLKEIIRFNNVGDMVACIKQKLGS